MRSSLGSAVVALSLLVTASAHGQGAPPAGQPPPAPAQPGAGDPRGQALELYRGAMDDYANANFGSALQKLEEASTLSQAPIITLARAYVLDKLGRLRDARRLYSTYLIQRPNDPDANAIRQRVAWIGQQLGEKPQPAPGATPVPGAAPAPAAAPPKPEKPKAEVRFTSRTEPVKVTDKDSGNSCTTPCSLQMEPGKRKVKVEGMPVDQEIDVPTSGASYTVAKQTTGTIVGGALLTGFGVAGIVVGGVFTIVGSSTSSEDPDTGEEESSLADVGLPILIAGGAMLVPGIVLLAVSDSGRPIRASGPKPSWTPIVAATPSGGLLGVQGRF